MSLDYFLDISAPSDTGANVVTCMELISLDISNCEYQARTVSHTTGNSQTQTVQL